MSLYNNVRAQVAGFLDRFNIPNSAEEGIANLLGNGKLADWGTAALLQSPVATKAMGQADKVLGIANTIKNAASGKPGDIAGLLRFLPGERIANVRFLNSISPLWGGITALQAKRIYKEAQYAGHVKKNLFLLKVSSKLGGGDTAAKAFNLFATDIEYSPFIISGEKTKVGGAVLDRAEGCEPTELTITTFDDQKGTLKNWFSAHHAAIAHKDGTLGVPETYAVTIEICHGIIMEDLKPAWSDIGLFRPSNLNVSLSRREDALEELQMTFSQMDTFRSP
jgi:hypothetical protein